MASRRLGTVEIKFDAGPLLRGFKAMQESIAGYFEAAGGVLRRHDARLGLARCRLFDALPDPHYMAAAEAAAEAHRIADGASVWDRARYLDRQTLRVMLGSWRAPLDVPHERAKLDDLGDRIAATRRRVLR